MTVKFMNAEALAACIFLTVNSEGIKGQSKSTSFDCALSFFKKRAKTGFNLFLTSDTLIQVRMT